jgi:hypothetical protein
LSDENFGVPEAEEATVDERDDEVVEPADVPALPECSDVTDAEEAPADEELSARAEVPSGSVDVRGFGTGTFPGRAGPTGGLFGPERGLRVILQSRLTYAEAGRCDGI